MASTFSLLAVSVERYLSYVSAFDPALRSRLRGAREEQLAELAAVAGRPLPAFYAEYLRHAGLDDGGIGLGVEGTANVDEIIAYYREEVLTGEASLPRDCLLFAVGALLPNQALDCGGPGEPPVVYLGGDAVSSPQIDCREADSLEGLLFRMAFGRYKLRSYTYIMHFGASPKAIGYWPRLPAARVALQSLGFEPLWFSDGACCCAERAGVALRVHQMERGPFHLSMGGGFNIDIAGDSRPEITRVAAAFSRELDLAAESWASRTIKDELRLLARWDPCLLKDLS